MSKSPTTKSPKKVGASAPPDIPTDMPRQHCPLLLTASACSLPAGRQEDAVWGRLTLSLNATETSTFELRGDKAQIVGRAAGSDVPIALPHISATHCTIREGGPVARAVGATAAPRPPTTTHTPQRLA